jgi:hypothetical protein
MKFMIITLATAFALSGSCALATGPRSAPRGTSSPAHMAAPRVAPAPRTTPGTTGMGSGAAIGGGAAGGIGTMPNNGLGTSASGCPTTIPNSPGVGTRPGC